jgi:hypothetical protein
VVEVDHKERGKYLTVGCPVKFSDFTPEITGSPLLGEHSNVQGNRTCGIDHRPSMQLLDRLGARSPHHVSTAWAPSTRSRRCSPVT